MDRQGERKKRDNSRDRKYGRNDRSRSPRARDRRVNRSRSPLGHADVKGRMAAKNPHDRDRDFDRRERVRREGSPHSAKSSHSQPLHDRNGYRGTTSDRKPARAGATRDAEMFDAVDLDDMAAVAHAMQQMMGFSSFRSTKDTKVPGNEYNWAVNRNKKTEYRQYMNRTGGFNRPLSPGK